MVAGMNIQETVGKRGRKYEQVLDGARTVFLKDGYEGASVDDIARTAGVSKATLYSYFADKKFLFLEIARLECARQADLNRQTVRKSSDVREVLKDAAENMMRLILSDFGLQVFRICVAESDRFPELGRRFYESGPMRIRAGMIDFFRQAIAEGKLVIDDCDLAADQFAELCKANLFSRMIFGIQGPPTQAEVTRIIDGAVETFMARYGAPASLGPAPVDPAPVAHAPVDPA